MKKIKSTDLLDELITNTQHLIEDIIPYKELSLETLNFRVSATSWSILECLEHLNLYGDFYLVEFEKRINNSNTKPSETFSPGILGNYFADSMIPKEGKKLNSMNTFKDKNPIHSELSITTIDRFLKQQERMIELLEKAKRVNISSTKCSITIPVFKLKLGDTFRFVINHNIRHILQAQRVYEMATNKISTRT